MSKIIGDVRIVSSEDVEWRMPDFDAPEIKKLSEYYSPEFVIRGERWKLSMAPNGFGHGMIVGVVIFASSSHTVKISVALKTANGQKEYERWHIGVSEIRFSNGLSKEEYRRRKSELCISGSVTIVCRIEILTAENLCKKFNDLWKEFNHLSEDFNELRKKYEDSQLKLKETEKELDACKADKESISKDKLSLEGDLKATRENLNDRPLYEDFKKVLLNGLNYDLTLKVGDKELQAHQDILRARSKVFKSMLSHDTKDNKSGIIDILDCDPQAMEQFLCYIYTGRVDSLEESNMLSLYYIADKYDMRGLKEKCSSFIKESISSLNFCKVIQLALNHSDHTLLEQATDYFTDNMLDIMCTVEWQIFMKDKTTVANELTIKSVKKLKTVKM